MSATEYKQELDGSQLRELLRVFRKNEWRGGMNPLTQKRGGRFSGLLGVIVLDILFSAFVAILVAKTPDIQSGLTLGGIFIMVVVAFQILLEYGTTIIASEDYSIIAPLPVSSRTFYVAKQIYFLTHVTILALAMSIAPVITATVVSGSVFIGFEALIVFWLSGVFSGELVSVIYALLLSGKRPERIERILGYAQMAFSVSFSLMYLWIGRLGPILKTINVDAAPLFKLAPAYWFTSLFRLINEGWRFDLALPALIGIVVLGAMYQLTANNLSLTYAQSLLRTGSMSATRKRTWRIPLVIQFWRRTMAPETRAVLTLMRAQFRGDAKFRLQSVVMVPMLIVIALYLTLNGTTFPDPFAQNQSFVTESTILYVMLMVTPMTAVMNGYYCSAFKAAWIFYTSPISREHLLTGSRTVSVIILLAPIFIGLTILFTYFYANLLHAVMHALFVTSIARMSLSLTVLLQPGVPFSLPMAGASGFSIRRLLGVFLPALGVVPMLAVEHFGYGGYLGYALILGASLLLGWALEKVTDPYLERRFKSWEFLS